MHRGITRARSTAIVAVGLAATLICGIGAPMAQARPAASTSFVTGAGSTFVAPLMTKWAFAYGKEQRQVRVNYQAIGSGAGISALTNKTVDFAASDAFLNASQTTALGGNAVHIPLTIGPVAVLYNLPGVSATIKLDGQTLAQIFLGKITSWNDKAIASLNPGVNLPSTSIVVAHRSDGSGTSFIFTSFLAAVSTDWKASVGPGALTVNWPTGQGGKGTPGVAQIVKRTPGAIGYAELSYAVTTGLPAAAIKNKDGQFVAPSPEAAAADAENAGTLPADLKALIVNSSGAKSYPITGFSWAIVLQKVTDGGQAQRYNTLLHFLWWCTHQGQKGYPTSGSLRYAALPANVVSADEKQIRSVTFNGKPIYNG